MLKVRALTPVLFVGIFVQGVLAVAGSAAAQELAPHRAVYSVATLDHGKPNGEPPGTYAYELKLTCEDYVVSQRLRLEIAGPRGTVTSEQQSQMTESRDGKKLRFEHRSTSAGRQSNLVKGEALLGDDDSGEARFSEPEGQTAALPAGTRFPMALARETIRRARAGESGFDALFFFGEKVKPPQSVNVLIGKVPKRLGDVKIPAGAEQLVDGRAKIYYRAGFFDAQSKGQGEPVFEMSSLTLDNGIELYGTHEERENSIEYRITRLEPLPKPECK